MIAGTHGKTPTTSLMAWAMERAGANPSFLIGGVAENFNSSFRITDGDYFVIEGDAVAFGIHPRQLVTLRALREEIVQTARRILVKDGPEAVSLRAIARRVLPMTPAPEAVAGLGSVGVGIAANPLSTTSAEARQSRKESSISAWLQRMLVGTITAPAQAMPR